MFKKPIQQTVIQDGTSIDHYSSHAYTDKTRFYSVSGESHGGFVGQNKTLKLPCLALGQSCFHCSPKKHCPFHHLRTGLQSCLRLPGCISLALDHVYDVETECSLFSFAQDQSPREKECETSFCIFLTKHSVMSYLASFP